MMGSALGTSTLEKDIIKIRFLRNLCQNFDLKDLKKKNILQIIHTNFNRIFIVTVLIPIKMHAGIIRRGTSICQLKGILGLAAISKGLIFISTPNRIEIKVVIRKIINIMMILAKLCNFFINFCPEYT